MMRRIEVRDFKLDAISPRQMLCDEANGVTVSRQHALSPNTTAWRDIGPFVAAPLDPTAATDN